MPFVLSTQPYEFTDLSCSIRSLDIFSKRPFAAASVTVSGVTPQGLKINAKLARPKKPAASQSPGR